MQDLQQIEKGSQLMKFELTRSQSQVIQTINYQGNSVFAVGGAVRDLVRGVKPKDIDLATNALPLAVKTSLQIEGFTVIPDTVAFHHGIVRAVDKDTGELIDIATLRRDVSCDGRHAEVEFTDNIEEDLARRDLTINAMAAHISPNGEIKQIIDPFGGRQDLQEPYIQLVGDPDTRIAEDYVRMVRACRFTALWEDAPDTDIATKEAIQRNAEKINTVSKERIRDEILKALAYPKPSNFFRALDAHGLLDHVFPDLKKGVGCGQNKYHAEAVFDHLVRCCDVSVGLTDNVLLRLAALTHDVAKPHTRSVDPDGSVHFYKHEIVGASVMYEWMREYKFRNSDIEYVTKLVRHHQWRFEDNTKDKTIRRWLQDVGKEFWRDLITLRMADRGGNLKKAHKPMITLKMRELMERAQGIIDAGNPIFKEDLAINGHDLQAMGIPPGKEYKEIFRELLGLVINEPEKNTKEALTAFVQKHYVK
jgi:tRNA nucleotidyltransferase (CCA-adding enzyme)